MRSVTWMALVMFAGVSLAGCDFGKSRELTLQLAVAEAEKKTLRAENAKMQAELEAAQKRIEDLEKLAANLDKLKEALGKANEKLPRLLEKYSEGLGDGLKAAKELGLPELKDVPVDALLKNLLGDKEADQEKDTDKKKESESDK